MKNIEKFSKEISQLVNEGNTLTCAIAIAAGISNGSCFGCKCSDCQKKCLEWMYSEYKEEILSDDEKDIINSMIYVIQKTGCEVVYVCKYDGEKGNSYIWIKYKDALTRFNNVIGSPWFNNDMFKGMKVGKEYKLEELGITCPTQKDNYVRQ